MRRLTNIAFAGAIALAGASLAACSSDSDIAADNTPVNPTYDGHSVKTKFAINIAATGKTRMGEDATQGQTTPVFLGMKNLVLIPGTAAGTDAQALNNGAIKLANINAQSDNKLVPNGESQYVYSDVNIPVGTKNFLFYGVSSGTTNATNATDGILTSTLDNIASISNTDDIEFTLNTVLTDASGYDIKKNTMAEILTNIAAATGWSSEIEDQTLKAAYTNFTTTTDKVRGGSSDAILRTVQDLYNVIVGKVNADNEVAKAIKTAIEVSFTIGNVDGVLSWKDASNENFPGLYGLPDGAVQLVCEGGTFSYSDTPTAGSNKLNIYGLTYPASLYYFANTPAKASDQDNVTWPTSSAAWESGFTGWTDDVKATSRTIALQNNINYGVAKLETTVKCDAALLEDNAVAMSGTATANKIKVPTEGFKVTAVLVGGQPDKVNWQFVSESTDDTERAAVVYDTEVNGIVAKHNAVSTANHTLLLDNWTSATTGQEKVNIAIELVNGDQDFYGVDGLIGAGQKFYLVAQLDPDNGGNVTFPETTKCVYPHTGTARVFMQDFTTKANLNIKSLKSAYVTIPDLRSSKLQLGLSVDLNWQAGMSFDVDL